MSMRAMRLGCCATVSAALLLSSAVLAGQPTLTQSEEEELVSAAVVIDGGPNVLQMPSFELDPSGPNKWYPAFDFYQALSDVDPNGSAVFDSYAVNRRNGDVWNAIVCREYKSASLAHLQIRMRRRLGLSSAGYSKARVLGPECGPGIGD
jgi:hypothetical protein